MIVGRALLGAEIDVGQDAEAELGVLVEDLPGHGIVGAEMAGHKVLVDENVLQSPAHPFHAVRAGIGLEKRRGFPTRSARW